MGNTSVEIKNEWKKKISNSILISIWKEVKKRKWRKQGGIADNTVYTTEKLTSASFEVSSDPEVTATCGFLCVPLCLGLPE
jgi:hypothetical protein